MACFRFFKLVTEVHLLFAFAQVVASGTEFLFPYFEVFVLCLEVPALYSFSALSARPPISPINSLASSLDTFIFISNDHKISL